MDLLCYIEKEKNYLVFVYTKKNIPFIKKPTEENIEGWLNTIEPDEKHVDYEDFEIDENFEPDPDWLFDNGR